MAIIKCPECGGFISSTDEHCRHCGCAITVCPECGTVYKGKIEQCTACGFKMGQTQAAQTHAEEVELIEQWRKANEPKKKGMSVGGKVLYALAAGVFVLASIYAFDQANSPTGAFQARALLLLAGVIACIFVFLARGLLSFSDIYLKLSCSKWAKEKNLDIRGYVKKRANHESFEADVNVFTQDNLIAAGYYSEHPNDKYLLIIGHVITVIFELVESAVVVNWVIKNFNKVVAAIAAKVEFSWSFMPDIIYIGILLVVVIVVEVGFEMWRDSRIEKWKNSTTK